MRFYKFIFLLLLAALPLAAQTNTVTLPANTPLYKSPDPKTSPIIILFEKKELQSGEVKTIHYTSGALLLPLKFHQVLLPGAGIIWAAPGLEYSKESPKDTPTLHPRKNLPLRNRGIGLLVLALLCTIIYFTGKWQKIRYLLPYAGIFLFCAGIYSFALGQSGNIIQGQADDPFYFQAARDILDGKFSGPWHYTIGFPLLYIPFILLTGAKTFEEFYPFFLIVNCCIFTPACLCFAWAFFRKLTNSKIASATIIVWSLLAVFWQFRYITLGDPNDYGNFLITSYAAPPLFSIDFTLYSLYTWFGVNCVSDTAAAMLLFAGLYMFFTMQPTRCNLMLFALLFGFICLVRLNNIFYAPAFILLYFDKYKNIPLLSKKSFQMIVPPCLLFLAVIALQLLVNHHHFGSPFTTPYTLHSKELVKWDSKFILDNIQFLFTCNKAWFLPALLMVFLQPDQKLKRIFILWCIPVTLFFTGYGCTFNSPIRFLLPIFPVMAFMIVTSPLWHQWKNYRNIRLLATILSCIALTSPWMPDRLKTLCGQWNFTHPATFYMTLAGLVLASLLTLSFAVEYYFYRKQNDPEECKNILPYLIYSVLFILLWIEPTGYGVFGLSVIAFFCIIKDLISAIIVTLKEEKEQKLNI